MEVELEGSRAEIGGSLETRTPRKTSYRSKRDPAVQRRVTERMSKSFFLMFCVHIHGGMNLHTHEHLYHIIHLFLKHTHTNIMIMIIRIE